MDVDLSDDQRLLADTAVRFIEERCPVAAVRAMAEKSEPPGPDMIREAAALGWFGLFVPEEFGGGSVSGVPIRDAAIVAEERGRFVQPGPFVATNVVAFALAEAGQLQQQKEWLPRLASGEAVAAWAVSDSSGAPVAGALKARFSGSALELSGTVGLVEEGASASVLLATALTDSGEVVHCLVPTGAPGVEMTGLHGLDLTRRFVNITFDRVGVPEDAIIVAGSGEPLLARMIDVGATLSAAESVGTMSRLLELTVTYAKDRTAFGRPIGSFQALKHLLADASLSVEVSAAGATAAAQAIGNDSDAASETVSIAKAYVGDAGISVAQTCQQIHGGIGFTWEHDLHFYLRRLTANRVLYGDPPWHLERICRIHGI